MRAGKKRLVMICLSALWSALMLAGQYLLSPLPNIEVVSLLLMVYTCVFGKWSFAALPVFILGEGFLFGFGTWWFSYLYIWAMLVIVVLFAKRLGVKNPLFWAIISGFYGLVFGFLSSFPYLFMGGPAAMFSYFIGGLTFDFLHAGGNFVLALVLFVPLTKAMKYLSERMGLLQKES